MTGAPAWQVDPDKLASGHLRQPAPAMRFGRSPAAAVIVSGAVISGLCFFGYNSLAGMAAAYGAMALCVVALLLTCWPDATFWRELRTPALWFAGALGWLGAVHMGLAEVMGGEPSMTPDRFMVEVLALLTAAFAMMLGCLLGGEDGQLRAAVATLRHGIAASLLVGIMLWYVEASMPMADWTLTWRGRFAGLLSNANVTAAAAGVLVLLTLAHVAQPQGRRQRWAALLHPALVVAVLELGLGIGTIVLTGSRFATVGTAALAVVMIVLRVPSLLRPIHLVPLGLAGALVAYLLLQSGVGGAPGRFDQVGFDLDVRTRMWTHFIELAADAPLSGYGAGSFASLHGYFLTDARLAEGVWNVRSAHDILLQIMLNGGLPYLLCLGAITLWQVRRVMRFFSIRTASSATVGLIGASLLLLACSLVDIILDVPAMILLLQFMLGLLVGRSGQRRSSWRNRQARPSAT